MTAVPKVFISYSYDNDDHKQWVHKMSHSKKPRSSERGFLNQEDVCFFATLRYGLPFLLSRKSEEEWQIFVTQVIHRCRDRYINNDIAILPSSPTPRSCSFERLMCTAPAALTDQPYGYH